MARMNCGIEGIRDARDAFRIANPHLLDHLAELADEREIVVSRDIVDDDGNTLWPRQARLDQSLRDRLFQRSLRQPLETCLHIEPGVTPEEVVADGAALLEQSPALRALAAPEDLSDLRDLSFCTPLTFILSVMRQCRTPLYRRALGGAIAASGLAANANMDPDDARALVLAALLRDIGMLYIPRQRIGQQAHWAQDEWLAMTQHVFLGHAFLRALTGLPTTVADGVLRHHDRQDEELPPISTTSPLMSHFEALIGVADTLSSILLRGGEYCVARGKLALNMLPGEFPASAVSFVVRALSAAQIHAAENRISFAQGILPTLQQMRRARKLAEALADSRSTPFSGTLAAQAARSIRSLDARLRAEGLYEFATPARLEGNSLAMGRATMLVDEAVWRLRHLGRHLYRGIVHSGDIGTLVESAALLAVLNGEGGDLRTETRAGTKSA